jgi:hypothetical protein
MAPELATCFMGEIEEIPASTKETDMYAFSMLALEVSDSLFVVLYVSLDSSPTSLCSPAYHGKLL